MNAEPLLTRRAPPRGSRISHGPRALALVVGLGVICLQTPHLRACEFPVCTALGEQNAPTIIADGAGGAFVAWRDFRDGSNANVYLQRLSAGLALAPGWPVDGIAVAAAPAYQAGFQLVLDGTGGVIVVWQDQRGGFFDIYAQRVTADGTIAPGWPEDGLPLCVASADQTRPAIASDGAGGAIVLWEDWRSAAPYADLYATRVTPDGTIAPGWAPNGSPVSTTPNHEGNPVALADGAGGAIIAWASGPPGVSPLPAIRAQRLSAEGEVAPGWPVEGVTLATGPWYQGSETAIVSDGAGGAIVAWLDIRNNPDDIFETDLFAHRVRADGTLAPGWPANGASVCVAPDTQWEIEMLSDGTGGAVILWTDYRNPISNASDVYGQRIANDGSIAAGWTADGNPLAIGPSYQLRPQAALDGLGGVVFAFEDLRSTYDLYSQRVLLDGSFPPGWSLTPRPLCVGETTNDSQPAAAPDGTGGLFVVATHDDPVAASIYATWVPGGVVTTLIALVIAEASPERVVLTWHGAERAGLSARVERRTEAAEWQQVAVIQADGVGMFRYEDREVRPGERYAYRLKYRTETGDATTAEEWVTVPAPRFALVGAQPNPVVDDLVVAFSLPDDAPARIMVFDLAGRQVLVREVSRGIGTHRVTLAAGRELPAGVYHLTLTQGDHHAMTRAVVIR